MQQETAMKIPWPITIVTVLVTLAIYIIAVIIAEAQTVSVGPAPSWWNFIAGHLLQICIPALVMGVMAWIIERSIRRSRRGV
jgi:hypothetical protein